MGSITNAVRRSERPFQRDTAVRQIVDWARPLLMPYIRRHLGTNVRAGWDHDDIFQLALLAFTQLGDDTKLRHRGDLLRLLRTVAFRRISEQLRNHRAKKRSAVIEPYFDDEPATRIVAHPVKNGNNRRGYAVSDITDSQYIEDAPEFNLTDDASPHQICAMLDVVAMIVRDFHDHTYLMDTFKLLIQEYSNEQIAAALQVTQWEARTYVQRVRRHLAKSLSDQAR